MAQRKPYNPNTAYGRRKLREQYNQNTPPEEQQEHRLIAFFICLAFAIIGFVIVYALKGEHAAVKWIRH
ncbi:hypothetical protein [Deminuibacter soli]|uniref:Uncharacterized protein n=1 Tax=Deminuibacter soli TaxID=2291815 RepID=A0A3E1NHQ6_9BACT|nr:hypothetical protein [Deminuibacter soli]RFM27483.1 hypothetical protein DXN05_15835 [Deminuibacter soli]